MNIEIVSKKVNKKKFNLKNKKILNPRYNFGPYDSEEQRHYYNSMGSGKFHGYIGKNPKAGMEDWPTIGGKSVPIDRMYHNPALTNFPYEVRSSKINPDLTKIDPDLRDNKNIKNMLEHMDESKGKWLFNIPLRRTNKKIMVYQIGNDEFVAYCEDIKIMTSKRTNENKKPISALVRKLSDKFMFDQEYITYLDTFSPTMTS